VSRLQPKDRKRGRGVGDNGKGYPKGYRAKKRRLRQIQKASRRANRGRS
jgi:hypothetical protein